MENLVAANLQSRPTRTVVSIVAVAIGVVVLLVIGGIADGTLNDTVTRTMGLGADFILQPSDAGLLFALGSPGLPIKIADKIRDMPGVGAVAPVLAKFSMADFSLVFGIELSSYDRFPGTLLIVKGKRSLTRDDLIVDELFAKTHNLKPGMPLKVGDHTFRIVGICRQGSVVREFVSLNSLQEIMETRDKVSMMFIKAAPGVNLTSLEAQLRKVFLGYHVNRANDASLLLEGTKIPGLKEFRVAIVLVSTMISFIVILLAMYTTIFERTREIGILKSLGASRTFIVSAFLRESAVLCFLGVLLGTGISEVIRKAMITAYPTLQVQMSFTQILFACLVGLAAGLIGALYPACKAARMDPVRALSYE